jgi:hypothetical protein
MVAAAQCDPRPRGSVTRTPSRNRNRIGAVATDEAPGRAALEAQRRALAKRKAKEAAAKAAAAKAPPADAPTGEPDAAALREAARKQQGRPLPHDEHYILALM